MESEILSDNNNRGVVNTQMNFMNISQKCNFRKTDIQLANGKIELAISFYSNALLVIISSNGKLGNFWVNENEEEDSLEDIDYEVRCILGNRKDEVSQFFSHAIINHIFTEIKSSKSQSLYSGIKKVLLSFTMKYDELLNIDVENQHDLLLTTEFKKFFTDVKKKVSELLFE
jgi:hypothetical protein